VIANAGLSPLTISGYAYTIDDLSSPGIVFTNTTFAADGTADLGHGFTSGNLLRWHSTPSRTAGIGTINVYSVDGVGDYKSFFNVWTDGGKAYTILEGSALQLQPPISP
jgi:iron transport multicopper oxidase